MRLSLFFKIASDEFNKILISRICSDDLKAKKRELREFFESKFPEHKKCDFAGEINKLEPSKAKEHARSEYALDHIYFYGVMDGMGPSRPNFEFNPTLCSILESKWEIVNARGDVVMCRGQAIFAEKAYDYASQFNLEMTKLIREDPKSYACLDAITSH